LNKKEEIGHKLKEFVKNNYPTLKDFAEKMGKGKTFFTRYFNGTSTLGGELLSELREKSDYKLDLNWLLTGKGEPFLNTDIGVKEKIERPYDVDIISLRNEIRDLKASMYDLQEENKEMKLLLTALLKDNITLENKNLILSVLYNKIDDKDENASLEISR
jgi:transcriptional regulator with XRE-family HTH domain